MVKSNLPCWQQPNNKLIHLTLIGLGNHGPQYHWTHHNLGQLWLDFIAQQHSCSWNENSLCWWTVYQNNNYQLLLIKPKTWMNLSGPLIHKIIATMKLDYKKIIICNDNLDLQLKQFKLTNRIPNNGHKGLASIVNSMKTEHMMTWQLGIGKQQPVQDWVLQSFSSPEKIVLFDHLFPFLLKHLLSTLNCWDGQKDFPTTFYQKKGKNHTNNLAIIGGQWGDEGKGKIVDYFASQSHYSTVARFSGGDNAGHTVWIAQQPYYFSILPVSVIHPHITSVIGRNCLLNLEQLIAELNHLKTHQTKINLHISPYCHLIMPYHLLFDQLQENQRGQTVIGTTKRGIGPCLEDKVSRFGLRVCDLFTADHFAHKLQTVLTAKNQILTQIHHQLPLSFQEIYDKYCYLFQQIKPYITDVFTLCRQPKHLPILFEGAQGTLLDINFGTYPFVTSSETLTWQIGNTFGDVLTNTTFLGVFKVYSSRVGQGPFPTELDNGKGIGQHLVTTGNEFGVVTKRKRRVGWFDAVLAIYACQVNGFSAVALTLLDVLTGCQEVKICTGYQQNGKVYQHLDSHFDWNQPFQCQYITLPGWKEPIQNITNFNDLPVNAQKYVVKISQLLKVSVTIISVGKERNQVIVLKKHQIQTFFN